MGKTQRQVSLPKVWVDEIEDYFNENQEAFVKINIRSCTELLKVLANLGRERLERLLQDIMAETDRLNGEKDESSSTSNTTRINPLPLSRQRKR